MGKLLRMKYLTTEHTVEDMLIEEKEVICLDSTSYKLTLSIALARLHHGLKVKAKVVKGYNDSTGPVVGKEEGK